MRWLSLKNKEIEWVAYEGFNLTEAQKIYEQIQSLINKNENTQGDNILIRPTKVIFNQAGCEQILYRVKVEGEIIL